MFSLSDHLWLELKNYQQDKIICKTRYIWSWERAFQPSKVFHSISYTFWLTQSQSLQNDENNRWLKNLILQMKNEIMFFSPPSCNIKLS